MSYPSLHALAAIAKELGADGLQFDETGLARINIGKTSSLLSGRVCAAIASISSLKSR